MKKLLLYIKAAKTNKLGQLLIILIWTLLFGGLYQAFNPYIFELLYMVGWGAAALFGLRWILAPYFKKKK